MSRTALLAVFKRWLLEVTGDLLLFSPLPVAAFVE
jgi:hypothetical protein